MTILVTRRTRLVPLVALFVVCLMVWGTSALAQNGRRYNVNNSAMDVLPDFESVWPRIRRLNTIRVFMAQAPGLGHQGNSANIVRRLREMGFENTIEVVYQQKIAEKVKTLFPEFDPDGPSQQTVEAENIKFMRFEDLQPGDLGKVSLGITGGMDFLPANFSQIFNSEVFFLLSPPNWRNDFALVASSNQALQLMTPFHRGYQLATSTFDPAMARLSQTQSELAKNLTSLLENAENLRLAPIYGHEGHFNKTFAVLLDAITNWRKTQRSQKPMVLTLFQNFDRARFLQSVIARDTYIPRTIKWVNAKTDDVAGILATAGNNDLIIVEAGNVEPAIYDQFLRKTTWFAAISGKNTANYVQALNKPFFVMSHKFPKDDYPVLNEPEGHELFREANRGLVSTTSESQTDLYSTPMPRTEARQALISALKAIDKDGSALHRYYQALNNRAQYSPNEDRLSLALRTFGILMDSSRFNRVISTACQMHLQEGSPIHR